MRDKPPPDISNREPALDALLAEAEALHAEFITGIIEAGDFCPWARGARLGERSEVRGCWLDELPAFLRALPSEPEREVWQLVVPDGPARAMPWREHVAQLERALRREDRPLPFAFAAFHPQHPGRPESIGGTIGLLRRSPLPAIQLIRLDALDNVRARARARVEGLAEDNKKNIARLTDGDLRPLHAALMERSFDLRQRIAEAHADF